MVAGMKNAFLLTLALLFFSPLPSWAQDADKTVPATRAQAELSFAPLVKQVSPAVVNIYTSRVVARAYSPFMNDPFFEHFFGQSFGMGGLTRRQVENSLGSGVLMEPDGLIVTNAHVIRGADEIKVVLNSGKEYEARKVLADDASDLALLRIDAKGEQLPYVTLKPSETLEVGDMVLAIGNPFGVGQTVTSGIVSALARSSLNINDFNFFIQTDAAINPGNSGGPLVAMDGHVVGINSAIFSRTGGSLGIGFAIPSEMVASVIAAEKAGRGSEHGVVRAWMGVTGQKLTSDIAESLGLADTRGVLVAALSNASPARKEGLDVGDVIIGINGRPVGDPAELKFRMATIPLGSEARFDVVRKKGGTGTVTVQAIAPPDEPPRAETVLEGYHPLAGVKVANLNPAVAAELGLREDEGGVVIVDVDGRSGALRFADPGDRVVAVNGRDIDAVATLREVLEDGNVRAWQIVLSRDGRQRQIIIR